MKLKTVIIDDEMYARKALKDLLLSFDLAFELNVFDYLLKPISIERFSKTVEKLQKELKFKSIEKLPVKNTEGIEFIDLNTIKYLESFDKTLIVYHEKGTSEVYKYKISDIEGITDNKILRIHKSYAVNVDKIIKFGHLIGKSWFVTLDSGEKVHVSKTYVEKLKKRLNL